MKKEELDAILAKHKEWLSGEPRGERANLSSAYLSGANLGGANLSSAYLSSAHLSGADLSRADLSRADLGGAYLSRADLSRADLGGANLAGAYLSRADLSRADLGGANLAGAYLNGVNLEGARRLDQFKICPEGDIVGWKKLKGGLLARVTIPREAKRVNAYSSRKCRAEYVVVDEIIGGDEGFDQHTGKVRYAEGLTIWPDAYDDDPRVECSHGIHFFITRGEAEAW